MKYRNTGAFQPYFDGYRAGDMYLKAGSWFVVGRDGSARPTAAPVDPADIPQPGKDGVDGRDGVAGKDGADGESGKGFNYLGAWRRRPYAINDVIEHEGSSYVCRVDGTKREPSEDSRHWGLLSKAGADGKDGATYYTKSIHRTEVVYGQTAPLSVLFDSATPKGAVVYTSGAGRVDLSQASGEPQAFAIGLSLHGVAANSPGEVITSGPFTNDEWSLTPGAVYYLSPSSPGGITTTFPTNVGEHVCIIGAAVSTTTLNIEIHWALIIGA